MIAIAVLIVGASGQFEPRDIERGARPALHRMAGAPERKVNHKDLKVHKLTLERSGRPRENRTETKAESFTDKIKRAIPHVPKRLGHDRRLEQCYGFDDDPHDPTASASVVADPWNQPEVCKVLATFVDDSQRLCSGTLIGPYHFLMTRSCGRDACVGYAKLQIACGFGYDAEVDAADWLDYAHLGTAYVDDVETDCEYLSTYKDACTNRTSYVDSEWRYDMQICKVDREIGMLTSWFNLDTGNVTSLQIAGYPGYIEDLETYIPNAYLSRLWRLEAVDDLLDGLIYLYDAYIFPGESGSPYYQYISSAYYISGIHLYGLTGCYEVGALVSDDLVEVYKAIIGETSTYSGTISEWTDPGTYCQVIKYQADVFGLYDSDIIGLTYDSSTASYYVVLTLLNVGTAATSVTVTYYLSSNDFIPDAGTALGSLDITIEAHSPYPIAVSINLEGNAGYVGAVWDAAGCYTNDGTSTVIGYADY